MTDQPNTVLYRMVLSDHTCPYGLRAKQMLEDAGIDFKDSLLETREQVDAFKAKHGVATTPLVFIGGDCIGGSEDLARYLESADIRG